MPSLFHRAAAMLFVLAIVALRPALAADLQPFAIPAKSPTNAVLPDLRGWNEKPAGAKGHVSVGPDGHFQYDGKRLRLLGMVMGAPARAEMPTQAERLARWGFNAARIHGVDNSLCTTSSSTTSRRLNPTVLDNLHYWVNCLAEQGIYSNINLLVTRRFKSDDGLGPEVASMYWKHQHALGFFLDEALAIQKEFATQYLTAPNPYRNSTPLALDPAVALIEINNENGLIGLWYEHAIENMPPAYQARLKSRWNAWLKARYPDKAALDQAWGVIDEPLGSNFLVNGDFAQGIDGFQGWQLWATTGAEWTKTIEPDFNGANACRVAVATSPAWDSSVQLNRLQLSLQTGQSYTLSFWAKASDDTHRSRAVILADNRPWTQISMDTFMQGTTWKKYSRTFRMTLADPRARVAFFVGGSPGAVSIADVQLCTGGRLGGLGPDESLDAGTIRMPIWKDSETLPGQLTDWILFLSELEQHYWATMAAHVRSLGFKSVIMGSSMNCSPANLQADFDASDRHCYWIHPTQGPNFTNGTDLTDWTQEPKAMVNHPETSKARELALSQIAGRPNTISEYGHPLPNPYANDAPIFGPAYAALQDTDGLWFHSFNASPRQFAAGNFDHFGSMSMLANTLIGAALYRRDVAPARNEYVLAMTPAREREILRTKGSRWDIANAKDLGMPATLGLISRTRISIGDNATGLAAPPTSPTGPLYESDTGELRWDVSTPDAGTLTINTSQTKAFVGFGSGLRSELGGVAITTGPTRLNWCTIAISLLQGDAFDNDAGGRALIVTTGDYANTDWVWKDSTHTSISNWGRAPFLTEIIPGEIELPVPAARVKAWALSGEGTRLGEIPIVDKAGRATLTLGTVGNTLWYEVQISPASPTQQPAGPIHAGDHVTLTTLPSSTHQWQISHDGGATWTDIADDLSYSGATTAEIAFTARPEMGGNQLRCLISDGQSPAIATAPTVLTVAWSQFSALSARAHAGTGEQTLTLGFVFAGGGKPAIVRGVGPGLIKGEPNLRGHELADPQLALYELRSGSFAALAHNDNWGGASTLSRKFSELGQGALDPDSKDAALYLETLAQRVYTAQISGVTGTGVALAEAYDADFADKSKRLTALSVRNQVGTGSEVLIAGFVVSGDAPKRVIVRGVGPGLAKDVATYLADPQLHVYRLKADRSGWDLVDSNDNWDGTSATAALFESAGMGKLATGSKDAALVLDLAPGIYTAQVSGEGDTTGVALAEIYETP